MAGTSKTPARMRTAAPPSVKAAARPTTRDGVAELLRRLSEAEARAQSRDRERDDDAETIGTLLAQIADRDRKLGELSSVFGKILDRLRSTKPGATSLLDDILGSLLAALDGTRTANGFLTRKIEEARDATRSRVEPSITAQLSVTLEHSLEAQRSADAVDGNVARVADRLRDVERRELELDRLRALLLDDVKDLLLGVRGLHHAVGEVAEGPETKRRRKPPSKLPKRR